MKRKFLAVGMAFMICITVGARSWADEAAPAEAKPDEAKPAAAPAGAPTLDDIKKLLGLSIYLQGGYTYNFEGSSVNNERIFDQKANTFLIDLAEIQFQKDPAVGGVGFKLKVSAGETAKYIHASGLGNTDQPFDLTEAYISYVAPLGQ
ncbi:MAG: outer membrane beta-barrel protein, partial [Thermodesulfovibrionales bacterium]